MVSETSLEIVVALIPGRVTKTSLRFHVVSGTATAGTGGVPCSASWPLMAGLLVSHEALVTAR